MSPAALPTYADTLCHVARAECGLHELPIVNNMDCGHTDPMLVPPLCLPMRIDW